MNLQEIKDQVAQKEGFQDWRDVKDFYEGLSQTKIPEILFDKVTLQVVVEDRKDAAEKATASRMSGEFQDCDCDYTIDKSSITDRPLPELK
jgi:hypothetical protein